MNHGEHSYSCFIRRDMSPKRRNWEIEYHESTCQMSTSQRNQVNSVAMYQWQKKELGWAQNWLEIAKQRGQAVKHILSYNILQTSPLFDGEVSKKLAKYMLTVELEKDLSTGNCLLEPISTSKTTVFVDFITQLRVVKMTVQTTFGQWIRAVFRKGVCMFYSRSPYCLKQLFR